MIADTHHLQDDEQVCRTRAERMISSSGVATARLTSEINQQLLVSVLVH